MRTQTRILVVAALALLSACGGGGGSSDSSSSSCAAYKVFNGDECASEALPVVRLNINGQGTCTGTIVSEDVVLTAAHCVVGATAIIAEHDRGVQSATNAIANPLYNKGAGRPFDLGLVRFPNIATNFGVRPARFGLPRAMQVGDQLKVVGYGFDGAPALVNGNPRAATLTVQRINGGLIETLFDADGSGTCFGDSGGAATFNGGIVATVNGGGNYCGAGNTNTFTDLSLQGNYLFLTNALPGVPLG